MVEAHDDPLPRETAVVFERKCGAWLRERLAVKLAAMFYVIRRRNKSRRLWNGGEEEGERKSPIGLQAKV